MVLALHTGAGGGGPATLWYTLWEAQDEARRLSERLEMQASGPEELRMRTMRNAVAPH